MSSGLRRLAVFSPSLEIGGAERATVNLCNGLAARGMAVEIVLGRAEGPFLEDLDPSVSVVDLGCRRVATTVLALRRYLRRRRPPVLLAELNRENVIAVWARDLARVDTRVVVTEHNTFSVYFSHHRTLRHRVRAMVMRATDRRADGIIAVSEGVRDDLAPFLDVAPEAIDVAYNPIVTPQLLDALHAAPHPWLDDDGPPVVVAVGRLSHGKDYPTLLRAVTLVRADRPMRLVVLGEGPERPALEALVTELGLDEVVALPGAVSVPAASVARAAVYVLSSQFEGLPSALIEALPFGVPVVATDCPSGPREILADGRHGRLVPVGDHRTLADAIVDALRGAVVPPGPEAWAPFTLNVATDRYVDLLGSIARR